MDLSGYLSDGEGPLCTATVYEDDTSLEKGTLACTTKRVIYLNGENVKDIDINRIDAFEFREPEYPEKFSLGILPGSGGFLLWTFVEQGNNDLPEVLGNVGLILVAIGIVVVLAGYFFRRSSLKIHTGATSFEFTSRDSSIQAFPANLRK